MDTRPLFLLGRKRAPRAYKGLGTRLDPTLQCSHYFFKSAGYDKLEIKNQKILQAYRKQCHGVKQNAKKNVPLVKQNVMKLEVLILGRQRIDQKRRDGGEGVERG